MAEIKVVSKRPVLGRGHFSVADYLAFFKAWSESKLAKVSKITTTYDPARDGPVRVEITLTDPVLDLVFESSFENELLIWRGNFHKWE